LALADRLRRLRRRFIQALLRSTLAASILFMTIGAVIWGVSGRRASAAVTPENLFRSLDTGNRLMLAGIVLLAITPALQVVALLVLWIRERAWRFAATAALVIVLLATALWAGKGIRY
jgi:uncharacterized membrane protein